MTVRSALCAALSATPPRMESSAAWDRGDATDSEPLPRTISLMTDATVQQISPPATTRRPRGLMSPQSGLIFHLIQIFKGLNENTLPHFFIHKQQFQNQIKTSKSFLLNFTNKKNMLSVVHFASHLLMRYLPDPAYSYSSHKQPPSFVGAHTCTRTHAHID